MPCLPPLERRQVGDSYRKIGERRGFSRALYRRKKGWMEHGWGISFWTCGTGRNSKHSSPATVETSVRGFPEAGVEKQHGCRIL